jgi:hypothetical protein
MGRRKGGSSRKPTRSILDKIKKCKEYLIEIQKQKTPSNAEISVLNNKIKDLEKLKKNNSKIYCIRPKSIVKASTPSTPSTPSTSSNNSKKKLSPGAIAGIVIACIVVVLLISFGIYKLKQKK